MKRSTIAAVGGAAVGIASAAAAAALALGRRKIERPDEMLYARPDRMRFREVVEGVSRALLWGDPDHGAYAAFGRFQPGLQIPLHTHSHDITLVVLEGAYVYRTSEGVTRIEAGSVLYVPGGVPHATESDSEKGCLFYEHSPGAFDLNLLS